MFFGKLRELRSTLAFRLTLWYAGIFAVFSSVAFLLFYTLITSVLQARIDQDLLGQAQRFSAVLAMKVSTPSPIAPLSRHRPPGSKKYFFGC